MERLILLAIGMERALLGRIAKEICKELSHLLPDVAVSLKYLKGYPSTFHPLVPEDDDRLIVLHLKEDGGLEDCLLVNKKILFVFLPAGDSYQKSEVKNLVTRLLTYIEGDLVTINEG